MKENTVYKEIWDSFIKEISKTLSKSAVELWFSECRIGGMKDNDIYLVCQSDFKKDLIEDRYCGLIKEKLTEIVGFEINPVFASEEKSIFEMPLESSSDNKKRKDGKATISEKIFTDYDPIVSSDVDVSIPLSANNYTFDSFIEGSSNSFAKASCQRVASAPGAQYNPLFIHGPSGIGKTHLLWAIINELKRTKPKFNIIYVKGDDFTNQMVECLRKYGPNAKQFKEKYRKADIILLDDIQFIAGKEATQEEFFHTFNALYAENKQIVMTSDRPPKDIKTLEERLRTRFEGGLIVDIQPPDYELRMAIMKSKAEAMGINMPNEVFELIATNLKSNVRQLEGAIKTISAQSFLTGKPITLELAKSSVADLYKSGEPITSTVDRIFQTVARKTGISEQEIKGKRKSQDIAKARHICVYLMKTLTDMSLPAIGRTIGRSHSTVMNSIDNIETEKLNDSQLAAELENLANIIKGRQ